MLKPVHNSYARDYAWPNLSAKRRIALDPLVAAAHRTCPYSNATRNNIAVNLTAHGGK